MSIIPEISKQDSEIFFAHLGSKQCRTGKKFEEFLKDICIF